MSENNRNDHFMKKEALLIVISTFVFILCISIFTNYSSARILGDTIDTNRTKYKEGEVIIKFKNDSINFKTRNNLKKLAIMTVEEDIVLKDIHQSINVATFKSNKYSTSELLEKIKKNRDVEFVEPNYILEKAMIPNDPGYPSQWAFHNTGQQVSGVGGLVDADIDAPEAWSLHTNSAGVKIAIIDGGVALNHPDLQGAFIDGVDFADNDWIPEAEDAHATHIAGIIGAIGNNSNGTTGLNWNIKIVPIKIDFSISQAIEAFDYAIENNVKIINCSWGSTTYSKALNLALVKVESNNILVIAAAGNQGSNNENTHYYPSDYARSNIISVAATDQNDNLASFSNYGSTSVDVAAPGVNIYSTTPYLRFNETFEQDLSSSFMNTSFIETGSNSEWVIDSILGEKMAIGDEASYPYANNADGYITSNKISSTGEQSVRLSFDYVIESEDYSGGCSLDALWVQVYNGSSWETLDKLCGSLHAGTGEYDITSYKNSNLRIRFRWFTDYSVSNFFGAAVDNVRVSFPLRSEGSYEFQEGTSMAAPHVTGLAALLWGYKPELSMREVRNLILNTGDSLPNLYGKVATGKRINAHKALLYFDEMKPFGSIKLDNNAASTISNFVTLNVSASDIDGGIQYVRFSNNGKHFTGWREYNNTFKYWSLTAPKYGGTSTMGNKIVFAQFMDYTGKRSNIVSDLIMYDSSSPTGSVLINNGSTYTRNNIAKVNINANDTGAGVKYMRLSNNNRRWSAWKIYNSVYYFDLTNPLYGGNTTSGLKTVYVNLKDGVGNESTLTDVIKYDSILPTGSIVINSGEAQTSQAYATLSMSASDQPYYVRNMRFSSNGVSWSPWISYASTTSWNLTSTKYGGNVNLGTKWVYVQYMDIAGNISAKRNDSILFY